MKNIIRESEWEGIKQNIQIDFVYDNHYAELAKNELMTDKLNLMAQIDPYVGKYYSTKWVRQNILNQTSQEIEECDLEIRSEIQMGILPSPEMMQDAANAAPNNK